MKRELLLLLRQAFLGVRNPYMTTAARHRAFAAGLADAWEAVRKAVEALPEPPPVPDPADIRLVLDYVARGWAPPEVQAACQRLRRGRHG